MTARARSAAGAARQRPPPPARALTPQLATLVSEAPRSTGWRFEMKYDGYRILARRERDAVELYTRNGNRFTERAPSVAKAVASLACQSAVLDGELVSPPRAGSAGRTQLGKAGDFQALQNALREGRSAALVYFAFDLLFCDGEDLRGLPLSERKQRLHDLLEGTRDPHLRISRDLVGDGKRVLEKACELGLEGVIAKRSDAPYTPGRSKSWLKLKCMGREELVVVGFTPPQGARSHFGALLLATRDGSGLSYAGKVGTGFSQTSLRELWQRLQKLTRETAPLISAPRGAEFRNARWVEPKLVVEVAFSERTADGRLRHPSFQGLREDKPARDVRRERPA